MSCLQPSRRLPNLLLIESWKAPEDADVAEVVVVSVATMVLMAIARSSMVIISPLNS